jgi:arylformamidase
LAHEVDLHRVSWNARVDYDSAYANGPFIPSAETFPPRWTREAELFRAALGQRARTGIPYGPKPRNHLDLFLPEATPQGLLLFIHGGYWLSYDCKIWSHLAAGPVARGWACALPSYTLAPEARVGAMTQEIARALEVAASLVPGPVVVTGHSAGGHLSARMGCVDVTLSNIVRRVVPISPIADLEPISLTAMNAKLHLDLAEIESESPARLSLRSRVEAHIWVGALERPAFLWQARLLSEAWSCPWTPESGRHHFDVIDGLTNPTSALLSVCLD